MAKIKKIVKEVIFAIILLISFLTGFAVAVALLVAVVGSVLKIKIQVPLEENSPMLFFIFFIFSTGIGYLFMKLPMRFIKSNKN